MAYLTHSYEVKNAKFYDSRGKTLKKSHCYFFWKKGKIKTFTPHAKKINNIKEYNQISTKHFIHKSMFRKKNTFKIFQ